MEYALIVPILILAACVWRLFDRLDDEESRRRDLDWRHCNLRREYETSIKNMEPFGDDEPRVLKRLAEIITEATDEAK